MLRIVKDQNYWEMTSMKPRELSSYSKLAYHMKIFLKMDFIIDFVLSLTDQ